MPTSEPNPGSIKPWKFRNKNTKSDLDKLPTLENPFSLFLTDQ
jgi:hypothetical protein